jgi:hypothetical protein
MDLNEVRRRVLAARTNPVPRDAATQELVDRQRVARDGGFRSGDILVTPDGVLLPGGSDVQDSRPMSRVTPEIFAAASAPPEGVAAAKYLPANHQPFQQDGQRGWVYDITTRRGRTFTFFLYWDRFDATYEVLLIAPEYEKLGLAHEMHIFPSGRLCLSDGTKITELQNAFGRSAMWADGICQMIDGHSWPWGESDDYEDSDDYGYFFEGSDDGHGDEGEYHAPAAPRCGAFARQLPLGGR